MTYEDAKVCIQTLIDNPLITKGSYLAQALDMAIKALEQHPQEDIHREREQAYMQGYEDASKRYRQPQDGDLISRKTLLTNLWQYKMACHGEVQLAILEIESLVEKLPSVSQPKTGHWISREGKGQVLPFWGRYECSECGECAENSSFCPNCGADMREDGDADAT